MSRTLLLLLPAAAQAGEAVQPGVSPGTYLQAGFALALIVALLAATAWLARKVSAGKGFGQAGMKVIGGVALGPRERIVLVEIGNDWLVIGIVPGQIRTLHRLDKGSLPEAPPASASEKPFAQWLQTVANRSHHD
ncbi:flagellar biosynthetic protein FliO [Dechloromonas sp. ARDL1]|uniref:flagellar biosynthetic protein FliO n=1 Tax=Dechloromonas sp. ARDL1 TaxID=3322121 RepID=UPI003DA6FB68